tara:strand:- start:194 stop:3436 length:3243 start_codon:yes stop_codon:yes gene_type:complete
MSDTIQYLQNLQSMGFAPDLALSAIELFGDDIHACCEWILRQNMYGKMPKRFKRGKADDFTYTFLGSSIDYAGERYFVKDFDAELNIILIGNVNWISLGDPALSWINEEHKPKPIFKPVSEYYHYMGDLHLPYKDAFTLSEYGEANLSANNKEKWGQPMIDEMLTSCLVQGYPRSLGSDRVFMKFGNLPQMYNLKQTHFAVNKELGYLWKCIFWTSDKHNERLKISPDGIQPRHMGFSHSDAENIKAAAFSKIKLISKIYSFTVEQFNFPENLKRRTVFIHQVRNLPCAPSVKAKIMNEYEKFQQPRAIILKKQKEWSEGCAASCRYELAAWEPHNNFIKLKLYVHDYIFSSNGLTTPSHRLHQRVDTFKNIFDALFLGWRLFDKYPEILHVRPDELDSVPLYGGYTCLTLKDWKDIILNWANIDEFDDFAITLDDTREESYKQKLLPHQAQLFDWMLRRERFPQRNGWMSDSTPSGFMYWYNKYLGITVSKANYESMLNMLPSSKTGGIISSAVGSGKTRTVLEIVDYSLHENPQEKTLVIMPTTMISTWEKECSKWIPNVIISTYHGNRRKISDEASIVLTTYRTVCTECQSDAALIKHDYIKQYKWKRIILDEGHQIRDSKSVTFRALKNIPLAPEAIKWIITATPVVKNVIDLSAYFQFLGIWPFYKLPGGHRYHNNWEYSFCTMLSYAEGYPHMSVGLEKLIKDNIFFQTKETVTTLSKLKTPVINESVEMIEPSPEHIHAMDIMKEMINSRLEKSFNITSHRLRYLLYLRLATYNPSMAPLAIYGKPLARSLGDGLSIVSKTAENINLHLEGNYDEVLKNSLSKIEEQNCPVCLDSIEIPTVTRCGHLFCSECIKNALEMSRNGKKCPLCREDLTNTMLREIVVNSEEIEHKETTIVEHGTLGASEVDNKLKKYVNSTKKDWTNPKVERLIKWFENNNGKCLIFTSLSTNIIFDIKKHLEKAKIGYAVIFGNMTRKQRAKSIERFQTDDNCRAFLLTSRSASYGLTLTAASTLIFFEPVLNESLKQQCIGRIDRLSQNKKSLDVISFVVSGSIEEKLLKATKDKDWFSLKDIGL